MKHKNKKKSTNKGFTLIELMVVVAVLGVLSSMALYIYNDSLVRVRITEGLSLTKTAKTSLGVDVATPNDLKSIASSWNQQNGGTNGSGISSKYVHSVFMDDVTGEITITYIAANVGVDPSENTLVMSPWYKKAGTVTKMEQALLIGELGNLDWACTSSSKETATLRDMGASILGTLRAKYAPAECR